MDTNAEIQDPESQTMSGKFIKLASSHLFLSSIVLGIVGSVVVSGLNGGTEDYFDLFLGAFDLVSGCIMYTQPKLFGRYKLFAMVTMASGLALLVCTAYGY